MNRNWCMGFEGCCIMGWDSLQWFCCISYIINVRSCGEDASGLTVIFTNSYTIAVIRSIFIVMFP